MRRYNSKNVYNNKLTCFACQEEDHFTTQSPKIKILHNKNAILIKCINIDLLEIDSQLFDNSSIYSIISIDELEEK